ncbi:MAG: membrane protein insertase YidC [Alphaproteobacteria bacterium]|nr:membrane protein insertase YidC [Alphaproteobacteria bacterium]
MGDQKNLLVAIVLSIAILFTYQIFYEMPRADRERAQQQKLAQQKKASPQGEAPKVGAQTGTPGAPGTAAVPGSVAGDTPSLGVDTSGVVGATTASPAARRETALKSVPRITIDSARLEGSLSLKGARIDDLSLRGYRETIEKDSPLVELLQPLGTGKPYYAEFGWLGDRALKLPNRNSVWTTNRDTITPGVPVTLSWDNGAGLVFEQRITLDDNYMFTVTQRVRNNRTEPVTLAPYGLISRTGTPEILGFYILHEGLVGVLNETLTEVDYSDLTEDGPQRFESNGGWLGITDKYWLTALIPEQKQTIKASFNSGSVNEIAKYQADYLLETRNVPAGGEIELTNHLFAGVKEVPLLDAYEADVGVPRFDLAVDFGWFYFLTKPIFYALLWLQKYIGNFGLAILALTVGIKLLFFPLANKSYKAMARMKALSPKMQALKERFGEDRQKMNEQLMKLYKEEKVNPAAGCLPMVIQIPVFFALYKVLFVTIEMRHAPFYGWIQDLSARDPLGMLTLFGLVDWQVPAMLDVVNIGIWPLIMGITMYLQQKLNPAPTDPMQAKIFMFMPIIFTFILAPFPAGLVIYWAWNNVLGIAQQWTIMKRMGVK